MFSWFKKKKETVRKPIVCNDLAYVIQHTQEGKEVKGIDNSKLALISVKKQEGQIAVSIEFERDLGSNIFTEVHSTIVQNTNEAVFFFTRFGINGELSWLKEKPVNCHRKISLLKG